MSGIGHGLVLNRIGAFAINGGTELILPATIDVIRIDSAVNTPGLVGLRGGTARRFVMLVNNTGVSFDIFPRHTDASSGAHFLCNGNHIMPAGRFLLLWFYSTGNGWLVLGGV